MHMRDWRSEACAVHLRARGDGGAARERWARARHQRALAQVEAQLQWDTFLESVVWAALKKWCALVRDVRVVESANFAPPTIPTATPQQLFGKQQSERPFHSVSGDSVLRYVAP